MKAVLLALIIAFVTSCSSRIDADVPRTYSKMNERDNIGELVDDAQFEFERFALSIEHCDINPFDILFYPFKKEEYRTGLTLIYK